ncbi:hypothetical protein MTO96_051844 [Rhipicephalus appendiculatus]
MDFGYSCQTIQVATEDGYTIEVDRVRAVGKGNVSVPLKNGGCRNPVILIPGIMDDSGVWFVNYPSQSAGYLLADRGYDVWAVNTREVAFRSYSKIISQTDKKYWQWSFDEIGRYDVAAVIDHVLSSTNSTRVSLLGFSQGVASSLVLLSTRPQYNNKVDILIGYGPVANLSHAKYPVSWLMKMNDIVSLILDPSGNGGYLHPPDATKHVLQAICETFKGQLCSSYLIIMSLMSGKQLNKTRTPVILSHFPIGTSIQNLRHYVQCELIMDFGYSCETSQAITEDGYVLEVDRVRAVTDQNASTASGRDIRRKPIILAPGISCESGVWFMNRPSQSPGI